jgi:hypothetical protein
VVPAAAHFGGVPVEESFAERRRHYGPVAHNGAPIQEYSYSEGHPGSGNRRSRDRRCMHVLSVFTLQKTGLKDVWIAQMRISRPIANVIPEAFGLDQ